jgi:protein archease
VSHRYLPHTADIRVEIRAPSLEHLLAESVAVVRELVGGDSGVIEREGRPVTIDASEPAGLLLRLVRQLLDWFNAGGFIPARLDAHSLSPGRLVATIHGEVADPSRHSPQPEVKALTRHEFDVREFPDGWRAELLFDV